jgi:hypothetical protein
MFGDIFVKLFKFLRILYSLYKILAIFKTKYFFPIEFGRIIFRMANLFLGKNMENYPMGEIWPLKFWRILSTYNHWLLELTMSNICCLIHFGIIEMEEKDWRNKENSGLYNKKLEMNWGLEFLERRPGFFLSEDDFFLKNSKTLMKKTCVFLLSFN